MTESAADQSLAPAREPAGAPATAPGPARSWFRRWRPEQQNEAYLFLLPSLIGFALFVLVPIGGAFVLSFHHWNLIGAPAFVGVDNYQELLFRDPVFRKVLVNTLFYADFEPQRRRKVL